MSLEDKIVNPMVPAELPGQRSEPRPATGKKRRKSGVKADSALGKARKGELEEEAGGDTTAVLTLGASDDARRPQKKMLFESASDSATLQFTGQAIRREAPRTLPVAPMMPAASAPQPKPSEPVAAAVAATPAAAIRESVTTTPIEARPAQQPTAAPASKSEAKDVAMTPVAEVRPGAATTPIEARPAQQPTAAPASKSEAKDVAATAAAKSPVFQVASLVMGEPEPETQPQPEPKDEAQAELPLTSGLGADDVEAAPTEVAMTAAAKVEERFKRSLARAFDTKRANGLVERTVAAEETVGEDIKPAPEAAAPAPEPIAAMTPEPSTIETASPAEPQPAPAYEAPVSAAPIAEPKPESEMPSRGLSRSEAIARAARMSARPTARPVPTAAETLAAARTAQQQLRSADLPKQPGDIYGYWTRVKNGRRFPSRADFDAEQVAEHWPNSMLLTCGNGIGAGSHGNFSSVLRLDANRRSRPGDDLNFTSMITEWILATGGEAARAGAPVQDTEVFPTPDGTHAYKIVALPLSENQTRVDHVLCHLSRS